MFVRFLVSAVSLAVATWLLPGIQLNLTKDDLWGQLFTLAMVAAIFGVVNSLVKPLFRFVTTPLILITLGLFLLIVNAWLLLIVSWVAEQLHLSWRVADFGSAVAGGLIISIVSLILNSSFGKRGEVHR